MPIKFIFPVLFSVSVLLSACGVETPAATPSIITSTLPATFTLRPADTSPAPTATATMALIEGTATIQLNVRAEPNTVGAALGMVSPFAKVQIMGKDSSGNWYRIMFPEGPGGVGWVAAQYIQINAEAQIPVIGAAAGAGSGASGLVIQQVNVRSGPGTDYDSLGMLNPNDVVTLTGKDDAGAWLQISFAGALEGKGWVAASFVKADGAGNLPIVAETGRVIGTETPTGIPPTPSPTLIPAMPDGDSEQAPAVSVVFSANGTRALLYSSDVSSPEGDQEDWIQFTPYRAETLMQLTCAGNGDISAQILEKGSLLKDNLPCNSVRVFSLTPGGIYLVHMRAPEQETLRSSHYTLKIQNVN